MSRSDTWNEKGVTRHHLTVNPKIRSLLVKQYDTNPQLVTDPLPPLSPLTFAMPAIQFSDRHYEGIITYNLNYTETALMFDFLGNMEAKTGIIHSRTISEFAKRHGVDPSNFYGKDGYINRLNATGMVQLKIKDHQLCGRITETPARRLRNKKYPSKYPLRVSMLAHNCLSLLLPLSRKKTVLRMLLCLALHTDKQSGELNTALSTEKWGKLIGDIKRINVDRAVDFLNEAGVAQLKRRYVVSGRLPFVAMANGFLMLSAEKEKERKKAEKNNRSVGYDYRGIVAALQKFFGLNATGWAKEYLQQARRELLWWMQADGKAALSALKASPPNWKSV